MLTKGFTYRQRKPLSVFPCKSIGDVDRTCTNENVLPEARMNESQYTTDAPQGDNVPLEILPEAIAGARELGL
jgi:hypothetical protein